MKIFKLFLVYLLPALLVGLIVFFSQKLIDSAIIAALPVILITVAGIYIIKSIDKHNILKKLAALSNSDTRDIYNSIEIINKNLSESNSSYLIEEKNYKKTKSVIKIIETDLKQIITDFNWVLDKAAEVGGKTEEQKSIIRDTTSKIKIIMDSISSLESSIAQKGSHFETSVQDLTDMSVETARIQTLSQTALQDSDKLHKEIIDADNAIQANLSSIETIYESSRSMKKITETITDISSQTNLLAMNAAIEAAHAGEKGKGFAIVTSEVRKLAEKSAKQANGIDQILKDMDSKISNSREISRNTSTIFAKITTAINETVNNIGQISNAVNSQYKLITTLLPNIKTLVNDISNLEQVASSHANQSGNIGILTDKIASLSLEIQEREKLLVAKDFEILDMMKDNQKTTEDLINNK